MSIEFDLRVIAGHNPHSVIL